MSISNEAIAAVTARLQRHANKTFDITSDLLLELFDDESGAPFDGFETAYNLLVEAEEHLQVACRRIDETAGIVLRWLDKERGR